MNNVSSKLHNFQDFIYLVFGWRKETQMAFEQKLGSRHGKVKKKSFEISKFSNKNFMG